MIKGGKWPAKGPGPGPEPGWVGLGWAGRCSNDSGGTTGVLRRQVARRGSGSGQALPPSSRRKFALRGRAGAPPHSYHRQVGYLVYTSICLMMMMYINMHIMIIYLYM